MEAWQRIGTYAAGLALDSAGVKGDKEILGRMDMIVAAGGGERDLAVDLAIMTADAKGNSSPAFLNERLMNDLRPTLFLAQLSNLLAGNIAIVHGVCGTVAHLHGRGSSLHRRGADRAGAHRVRDRATSRWSAPPIMANAPTCSSSMNSATSTSPKSSPPSGSAKTRAVLRSAPPAASWCWSSREHAEARGAKPYAKLTKVVADLAQRKQPGAVTKSLEALWPKLGIAGDSGHLITGATGVEPVTSEEKAFLRQHPGFARCAPPGRCSAIRWKPSFRWAWRWPHSRSPAARCFRPTIRPGSRLKRQMHPDQIVVVGAGHWQGEGMALVEAVK